MLIMFGAVSVFFGCLHQQGVEVKQRLLTCLSKEVVGRSQPVRVQLKFRTDVASSLYFRKIKLLPDLPFPPSWLSHSASKDSNVSRETLFEQDTPGAMTV